MSGLVFDKAHRALVIIPTVADPSVLVPTVAKIAAEARDAVQNRGKPPIALVIAVNAPDPESARDAIEACRNLCAKSGAVDLEVWACDYPIGFGAANNRGLMAALHRWGGVPELTVFHNDDAHPSRGWLDGLLACLQTQVVHGFSEPWDPETPGSSRPDRDVAGYGKIGVVGPVSNLVAGIQQVDTIISSTGRVQWRGDVEAFAKAIRERYPNQHVTADFISGFCIGFSRELLGELMLVMGTDGELHPCTGDELEPAPPPVRLGDGNEWTPGGPAWFLGVGASASTATLQTLPGAIAGIWDEVSYPIAGYEDNDVCVRAELAGFRCLVAADVFVGHLGHQTFDRLFPEALRGLRNRQAFYDRWRGLTNPPRELNLGAVYRLRFEVGHDVHLFRTSLLRACQLVDRIAVVLTGNPLEVINDLAWPKERDGLHPLDRTMLEQCDGRDFRGCCDVVRAWIAQVVTGMEGGRFGTDGAAALERIRVEPWEGEFNERDERNLSHRISEEQGSDWIISIDHDEVIENRVVRGHFERLMRHPDPLVRSYDQSWANHWDHARLVRDDRPWGDDGTYVGGMHGFRLWRVPRNEQGIVVAPRSIMAGQPNGLHCGNSPDHDLTAKRVSGIRFRHFGYVRWADRERKMRRYQEQDKDPNPMLTGGTKKNPYAHLVAEEGMRMSPFVTHNGIGLHILMHPGEKAEDLARLLDQAYGVVDRIVLVWTDSWEEQDKGWLAPPNPRIAARVADQDSRRQRYDEMTVGASPEALAQLPVKPPRMRVAQHAGEFPESWPESGPAREVARMADLFGCEWVHQPLEDHLGRARNAGLEALAADANGMGWSWFMDLDEHFDDPFASMVALRRMAEVSDAYGWLFNFANYHLDQEPSRSESIRLARLVPGMEFNGRVHETFDKALLKLNERGVDISIRQAPFLVHHYGLAKNDEDLGKKFRRYQRLLCLELEDDPHNSQAWVSLAMHLFNDGKMDQAEEALNRGVICAGSGYLAFREKSFHHLRIGTAMLQQALIRVGRGHDFRRSNEPLLKLLQREIPQMPILGSARHGIATCPDIELPPFEPPSDVLQSLGFSSPKATR